MDEAKLIHRLQCRRRYALDQAIEQFTPYVGAVIWRILASSAAGREDVEEAVSDVFLALWAHAEELDPERGLRPWLGAVARNKALDVLRRLPPTCPLDEDCPSPAEGPQETLERREQARQLWQAVDGLEEPDRTLFSPIIIRRKSSRKLQWIWASIRPPPRPGWPGGGSG